MLQLIVGPMGSAKTTKLFKKIGERYILGDRCIYINHISDNRKDVAQSNDCSTSHSPNPVSLNSNITKKSVNFLNEININSYDAIAIDEAHFYPDLYETIKNWLENNKVIIFCAGLNADSNMNDIGQINKLYCKADEIIYLKAFCGKCDNKTSLNKTASFTIRLCTDINPLHVGGMQDYMPVCRRHYNAMKCESIV